MHLAGILGTLRKKEEGIPSIRQNSAMQAHPRGLNEFIILLWCAVGRP